MAVKNGERDDDGDGDDGDGDNEDVTWQQRCRRQCPFIPFISMLLLIITVHIKFLDVDWIKWCKKKLSVGMLAVMIWLELQLTLIISIFTGSPRKVWHIRISNYL